MCNLYSHVKGPKAIRDIAKAMGGDWLDSVGNLVPQPATFPIPWRLSCVTVRKEDANWSRYDGASRSRSRNRVKRKSLDTRPTSASRSGSNGCHGWKPVTAASCQPQAFRNTISAPRLRP